MLCASVVLNLLCWYWPKIATSFIYFESGWIMIDTILLSCDSQNTTLAQCVRFVAVGVLMGVYPRQTIPTVTIGVVVSQVYMHEIVVSKQQEDQDAYAIKMTVAVLIVPICVTAYFMSVQS